MVDVIWQSRVEAALQAVTDDSCSGDELLGHALVLAQEIERLRVVVRTQAEGTGRA